MFEYHLHLIIKISEDGATACKINIVLVLLMNITKGMFYFVGISLVLSAFDI